MKKTLSLILSLFMVFTAFSAMPFSAYAESETPTTGSGSESDPWVVYKWETLKEKMALGGYIRLGEDVTDPVHDSDSGLSVPSGITVSLDLNGFVLDRALTTKARYGYAIYVAGTLNITDSRGDNSGTITRGYDIRYSDSGTVFDGGGFFVNGGELNIYGGTISGNIASTSGTASSCGGGIYAVNATVNMYDGVITGNRSYYCGGGVALLNSTFHMYGGVIKNNHGGKNGGGVAVTEGSTFIMEDGTIIENDAGTGGGVYVYDSASSFTMNGGSITKNTTNKDDYNTGQGAGVYVGNDVTFNLFGGSITENTGTYWKDTSYATELGAGVYFSGSGFSVKGKPVVTGNVSLNRNTDYSTTLPCNVYVLTNQYGDQRINIAGALEEGASLGVTSAEYEAEITAGFNTYNSGDDPSAFFKSDRTGYKVIKNGSGEAEIKEKVILDGNVTPENIFDYFDASGNLTYTEAEELVFKGDFSSVSLPLITIGSTVKLTSDNAVFSGTSFLITADDVTLDGFDITQTGECAVKIDNASGVMLTNNKITFTGDRTKGDLRRALVVSGETDNPISTVTVKDNFFNISLASETVIWQVDPSNPNAYIPLCPSVGVHFSNCNEVNFISNTVTLKATEAVGSYDTVYAVTTDNPAAANAVFNANGNAVSVEGKTYAYAFSTNTKSTVLTENTVNCKSDYYASAVDMNIGGAGFNNSVVNNKITAEAELAYGVNFMSNSAGAADLASVENDMDLKGHFCLGVRFSEIYDKKKNVTAFGNTVTAEGDYLIGISVLGAASVAVPNNTITVMGTNTGNNTFWENCFNREYGSCGVYIDSDGVVTSNTINSSDIGIISLGGATLPNNTIVTEGEYTVDIGETNATVVSNTLNAKVRYGDDSIKHTAGELHNNTHAHKYIATSVQPTCTEKGYTADVCFLCSDKTNVKEIAALGHDFGNNEKTCKRCGAANPDYKEPAPVLTPEEAAMPTEEKTEELIKKTNTDKKDVAGSDYQRLMLKATSKSKSITLKWKRINGASGYIIYGAPCGKKMTRLATVTNPKTVKKTFKKLKKGEYYKYMVVAYKKAGDGSNRVISKSKSVHCTTPGGKKGNPTGISVKTKMTVKKGKKVKIKAKLLKKGKVATHIAKLRYESSNSKVATVDKNGYLKAKKKGTVTVYVYTQNGIAKTIKVKVK